MPQRPDLLVMALSIEARERLDGTGIPLLLTGVGKVNASMALTRALVERRLQGRAAGWVLNLGTAGSRRLAAGTLVECVTFTQRDMNVSALGFAPGQTPFDDAPLELSATRRYPHLQAASCSTGDSFVTADHALAADVTDMEAFALARVCFAEGVEFSSVKYVSDGADDSAAADWAASLDAAARAFAGLLARGPV
jgi:adenosylhomocysteine nucleosidase